MIIKYPAVCDEVNVSIFFLMCSERSGSNFITKLMNGHSKVCGPSTKHILNPVARNLFRYEPITDVENWKELVKDIYNLISVSFSVWKRNYTINDLFMMADPGDIAGLLEKIYTSEAKANGKKNVFIKENHVYEFLTFLLYNFPDAKYVYQVRDPRDMALSWKKDPNHPGGVIKAARQWKLDQQNTLKNHNVLVKMDKSILIKYEHLTKSPDKILPILLKFLGLEYEESILQFNNDQLTLENSKREAAWNNLSKGIITNNSNKYKNELSYDEIKAIEKICFPEMFYFDYKPEFSEIELQEFQETKILEIEKGENESNLTNRSDGVKANMKAKKVFYQKTLCKELSI